MSESLSPSKKLKAADGSAVPTSSSSGQGEIMQPLPTMKMEDDQENFVPLPPKKEQRSMEAFVSMKPKKANVASQKQVNSFFSKKKVKKAAPKPKPAPKVESKTTQSATSNSSSSSSMATSSNNTSATQEMKQYVPPVDDSDSDHYEEEEHISERGLKFYDEKYHPKYSAPWKKGEAIPYSFVADLFELCEDTSGRLDMISYVCNFIRSVVLLSPEQLLPALYLCVNKIAPAYENVELGIGDAQLVKALAETSGWSEKKIRQAAEQTGDLGDIAGSCKNNQATLFSAKPQRLTIVGVFDALQRIAKTSGKDSNKQKRNEIRKLLVAAHGHEAKFIIRSLQGKLRIGLAEKSVLAGLAKAVLITPPKLPGQKKKVVDARDDMTSEEFDQMLKDYQETINQALIEVPNYNHFVKKLLMYPVRDLPLHCYLTPGIPVQVMLGKPCTNIQQMLKTFADALFTCEFKYDGERAQIHMTKEGVINIYSRNSENHTGKYPDLIAMLPQTIGPDTQDFIIDCEVCAVDPTTLKILPFQKLSTRKRKAVDSDAIEVSVCLYAFDLLYYNGQSYLQEPFVTRRTLLREKFKTIDGNFQFAVGKDSDKLEDIDEFLQEAIQSSCEGLMVKSLEKDANYVPNKRNWLKLKKDYIDGAGDSFDLVPIAAWYGKGKRTAFFGAYLCACYDPDTEEFQTLSRVGTGYKDEDLKNLMEGLTPHIVDNKPSDYNVAASIKPDVWFEPAKVWEIKCADISISPEHTAAMGVMAEDKGIAIRFPRFIRERPDKKPENATSAQQVVQMYQAQSVVSSNAD